jgi:type IV fimbrial biogenesis protein FimT
MIRYRPRAADNRRLKAAGFTMVELITVIGMVGLLMAIGVPSYRYVTNANRMSAELNGLLGDLQFARAEAIRQGVTVTACASTDGATCTTTGNSWDTGWLIFADLNNNQQLDAATEFILRSQRSFNNGDTFQASNSIRALTFTREGFARGLPGPVTVSLHDKTANSAWARCLSITIVGAMTAQMYGTGGCT